MRRLGQFDLLDARHRDELRGLAVAEGDRAGLVEQQHVDVAGRLHRAPAQREHVAAHEPVHAGDADRAESSAPMVVGISATSSAIRVVIEIVVSGELGERLQRDDHEQEDQRQPGEQDVQRDLVRRLAPLGALDQRDHPVQEATCRAPG